jgi:hypothetical protein
MLTLLKFQESTLTFFFACYLCNKSILKILCLKSYYFYYEIEI